jgi:hypothetical protein
VPASLRRWVGFESEAATHADSTATLSMPVTVTAATAVQLILETGSQKRHNMLQLESKFRMCRGDFGVPIRF